MCFYHGFHVMWGTKYRDKVLHGAMRDQIREANEIAVGPAIVARREARGELVKSEPGLAGDEGDRFMAAVAALARMPGCGRIGPRETRSHHVGLRSLAGGWRALDLR